MSDPFLEWLDLIRLEVDIYHNAKVCGDWSVKEHSKDNTCFHVATLGRCQLEVPGQLQAQLNSGDLVIFPREIPHRMRPCQSQTGTQQHLSFSEAELLEGTGMLCGEIHFKHRGNAFLLDVLPAVFIIPNDDKSPWLNQIMALLVQECVSADLGSNSMINRLSELLFSYALRHYVATHNPQGGILSLFVHHNIGKAIRQIHADPAKAWSLELLAEAAGMSRTAFAETFKKISGWTATQYLTWWRMQLAYSHLVEGLSIANVAERIGYQSEAAFSRAFKKLFGVNAGGVRRKDS